MQYKTKSMYQGHRPCRPVKLGKLIRVRFIIMKCLNLSPTMVGQGRNFLKSRCSKTASE